MTNEQCPNEEASTESPAQAVDRVAGELEEVRRREVGKAVEYDRAGIVFAAREAGRLSFRLRADIAEHALRTPETSKSPRGREWVTLASEVTDTFTVDRAAAWFESAWRLAGDLPETSGAPN
jgi:nitrogen fixation/metabolism regulation signal transduction histidine kinase